MPRPLTLKQQRELQREYNRVGRMLRDGTLPVSSAPQVIAASAATTIEQKCDINGDGTVNTDDLLLVIGNWGPLDPTPPEPPPTTGLEDMQPFTYDGGTRLVENKRIVASASVNEGYGMRFRGCNATINNVDSDGWNYGLWFDGGGTLTVRDSAIRGGGGNDDYGARIYASQFISERTLYENVAGGGNKACFRAPFVQGGSSTDDTFKGERVMYGGGGAGEWDDPGEFHDFTILRPRYISVPTIEVYNGTHHVTWDDADFSGMGHMSIQPQSHHLTFRLRGRPLPQIRLYQSAGGWQPLTAAGVPSRSISVVA